MKRILTGLELYYKQAYEELVELSKKGGVEWKTKP